MPGMKRDCGGAAGVLGAFKAAVSDRLLDIVVYLVVSYGKFG